VTRPDHPPAGRCLAYIAPVFRVADLAESIAFYRDRLGFQVELGFVQPAEQAQREIRTAKTRRPPGRSKRNCAGVEVEKLLI